MSRVPSFEKFDYILRTNKHIERKLVFDILQVAAQKFRFDDHWYLGFGSMWFGDFRLANRALALKKMLSVEHPEYHKRANFNKPFSNITVEPGLCSEVLPRLNESEWDKPLVAWLDYDGQLSHDAVCDLDFLFQKAAPDSVILITINGVRESYRVSNAKSRDETSVGIVESFIGRRCTPPRFEPTLNAVGIAQDVSRASFPEYLAEAVSNYMGHRVANDARQSDGERLSFAPLFKISHKDGADMVTVGGALCVQSKLPVWTNCIAAHPILADAEGRAQYCRLDLIPVTLKEKIVLDACLPVPDAENEFVASARQLGIELAEDEIRKYRKFFRHFPVFVETSL